MQRPYGAAGGVLAPEPVQGQAQEEPPGEAPPSPQAGARKARPRRRTLAVAGAAVAIAGASVLWVLPGAGALEGGAAGVFVCKQDVPVAPGTTMMYVAQFPNKSSLPVTVTGVGKGKVSGMRVIETRVSVGPYQPILNLPPKDHPPTLEGNRQEIYYTNSSPWRPGETYKVEPGESIMVVFLAQSTDPGHWDARASGVGVDYHAWTRVPQFSVDENEARFDSGTCEDPE